MTRRRSVASLPTVLPARARYRATHGIVFIGVARERAGSFKTTKGNHISRQSVAVNHYYLYLHDREWGPCFLKVCAYAPFPAKLCLINGHEWAKQQLRHEGIPFESLDNGFLSLRRPATLGRTY